LIILQFKPAKTK